MRRTVIGLIVLAVGAVLLLSNLNIIDVNWLKTLEWRIYLVPALIMLVGVKLIFGRGHNYSKNNKESWTNKALPETESGKPISVSVVFAGDSYNYSGEEFPGAKIDALFGGVKLDLRNAKFNSDVRIDASTMFGGVEILVPTNIKVVVSNKSLLGGVGNHANSNLSADARTLYINASCFLGGMDIKN